MKENKYSLLLVIFWFALGCQPTHKAHELAEDRVVSLVPSVTDFCRLMIPKEIVGVSMDCDTNLLDHPKRIATYPKIDYETLLELRPTKVLVLAGFSTSEQINKLQTAGLKVVILSKETVQDVIQTPLLIDSVRGQALHLKMKAEYQALLSERISKPKSYLILISEFPLQVFGQGNYMTELFDGLGYLNKAAGFDGYPELQKEFFVKNLPDVLVSSDTLATKQNLQIEFGKVFKNQELSQIEYVQINQNQLFRPGPNFLQNARDLLLKTRQ